MHLNATCVLPARYPERAALPGNYGIEMHIKKLYIFIPVTNAYTA